MSSRPSHTRDKPSDETRLTKMLTLSIKINGFRTGYYSGDRADNFGLAPAARLNDTSARVHA